MFSLFRKKQKKSTADHDKLEQDIKIAKEQIHKSADIAKKSITKFNERLEANGFTLRIQAAAGGKHGH